MNKPGPGTDPAFTLVGGSGVPWTGEGISGVRRHSPAVMVRLASEESPSDGSGNFRGNNWESKAIAVVGNRHDFGGWPDDAFVIGFQRNSKRNET